MSTEKSDFLKFNAYQIKDLITRKLTEDSKFTDQIYEGSNLAILIDLVSYMYQCLLYQLNNAAAESMFSDTQIYKNINRLVRMIGYHPQGCKPTTMRLQRNIIDNDDISKKLLYPCTLFDTGIQNNGQKIYFSTDFNSESRVNDDTTFSVSIYNGIWKKYPEEIIANGTDYETFILTQIKSDSDYSYPIAFQHIKVIIENTDGTYDSEWNCDNNEIFLQAVDLTIQDNSKFCRIYGGSDDSNKVYTVYLNESKQYELKFGNGILGRKLNKGDKIHIFYLETNGINGDINAGDINVDKIEIKRGFENQLTWTTDNYKLLMKIYGITYNSNKTTEYEKMNDVRDLFNSKSLSEATLSSTTWSDYLSFYGIGSSTKEEDVQEIRENASSWFKQGNRLITKKDYEYFLKQYQAGIVDVKCMNNWDYMTTFYRWLYNMGVNPYKYSGRASNPYKFIEKYRLVNNGFQYVDSADANNIYLWIKMTDETDNLSEIKSAMAEDIDLIKTMTAEIYPLKPIDVYFDISFTPDEIYYDGLNTNNDNSFDDTNSYIEITMTDNSIFSNVVIQNKVISIIKNYFDVNNCKIGQNVNYSDILNKIYEINGVERVRTVFNPSEEIIEKYDVRVRHCDGLAFASWSNLTDLIPIGEDLDINNISRNLEQFQFPKLSPYTRNNLENKIKVIKKSMNTTNPVKF